MTKTKIGIDEGFIRAYASQAGVSLVSTVPTATGNNTEMIKLALPAGSTCVSAVFDPVSNEQNFKTRQLNQAVRKGYAPPTSLTK